ncbi:MAG: AI-2E family transporter [Thermodesulfobacteriota bacterium]
MLDSKPFTLDRVVRLGITAGLLWGLVLLLSYLSDVLIPFAVALLLAYLLNPLVVLVQKKVPNRLAAVIISLILVLIALALLVMIILPMIGREIGHMGRVVSDLVNNSSWAVRAAQALPPDLWQMIKDMAGRPEVQELFKSSSFWKVAEAVARKVMPGVWGLITGTATFLTGLIGLGVIALYLVFLLLDYQKVRVGWKELLPPAHRESIVAFIYDFDAAMNRHFRAQALVAAIVGALFAVGFSLIGLPLGILLGLLAGVLNMVPYLPLLVLPPALLMALVRALETGGGIWLSLGLTVAVFILVQIVDGTLLTPRIMGEVTGLSPAMILLSLSVWGKLLGMLGLLLALPLTCLVLAYYRRLLATGTLAPPGAGLLASTLEPVGPSSTEISNQPPADLEGPIS